MKKAYLTIIWVITIICIIGGTIYNVGNIATNVSDLIGLKFTKGSTVEYEVVNTEGTLDISGSEAAIEVSGNLMDLTIETGDSWNYEYESASCIEPTVKVENHNGKQTIVVTQPESPKLIGNNTLGINCKMTITMPEKASLTELNVGISLGDLNISDVAANTADIELDLGDMDVNSCKFIKSDVVCDLGDLSFTDTELGNSTIEADLGNIDLIDTSFDSMEITADLGDVDIKSSKDLSNYHIDAEVDMGNLKINGKKCGDHYESDGTGNPLTIDASLGDVCIEW